VVQSAAVSGEHRQPARKRYRPVLHSCCSGNRVHNSIAAVTRSSYGGKGYCTTGGLIKFIFGYHCLAFASSSRSSVSPRVNLKQRKELLTCDFNLLHLRGIRTQNYLARSSELLAGEECVKKVLIKKNDKNRTLAGQPWTGSLGGITGRTARA
jgi:hypothetical protein